MTHFVQDVKDIWRLAVPYFRRKAPGEIHLWFVGPVRMPENWIGIGLLACVVALEVGASYMAKLLNNWSQGFGDAIQGKDWHAFLASLGDFTLIVTPYLLVYSLNNYINQVLQIRWRKAMTDDFVGRWLSPAQHYRMRLVAGQADNPDQRISDDIHQFVGNTMVLGVGFFGNFLRLAIFLQVLWVLSTAFPMTSFGLSFNIPGYLVWLAVIYAGLGTAITYLIGRQLVNLKYNQERFEANFRFGMARIRENSEQIALLGGEAAERSALDERYQSILGNVYGVIRLTLKLNFFSFFFGQFSNIFPYLLLGPAFFFGTATYGTLMRSVSTFGRVQDGLTWFADSFQQLANYRAIVQRLVSFEEVMARSDAAAAAKPNIVTRPGTAEAFAAEGIVVSLPDRTPLTAVPSFSLAAGDRVLLSGRSGSGKTTLLRAFSGVWPYGDGRIDVPDGTRSLVLPQRSYLPLGTLRQAICYPDTLDAYADATVRDVLGAVGLGHLAPELDRADNWPQRLSGGEQQRLGMARAILSKPDWLFLDEATSALDADAEIALYDALIDRLPGAGIVSITHRPTLDGLHNRRVEMTKGPGGLFQAGEALPAAAE
ncbi:ABC transporter ATP-binding protein/permease [Lichenibacterium ramalinae]|uniref:ABC transporter ATP-binding protein/permease n=1 Tax=Lichenibacterium ramalinae TaxID=2316527 RepID=A0A4Q2RIJ7_9HYPH|nr:ABC transporter ATP-binding protein/permease [Lichenibacterium ramalinae]RYB06700.1 ABC transporter ATP-binding protein/permease [Lichenibacterium ramalinae]